MVTIVEKDVAAAVGTHELDGSRKSQCQGAANNLRLILGFALHAWLPDGWQPSVRRAFAAAAAALAIGMLSTGVGTLVDFVMVAFVIVRRAFSSERRAFSTGCLRLLEYGAAS